LLKATNRIDLRKRRLELKKEDPILLKRSSFADIVTLINRELVDRYNEKIERKKSAILLPRIQLLMNEYDLNIAGIPQSRLIQHVFDAITGYDILHNYIADPTVTNIEVEGPDDVFFMKDLRWKKAPISFGSTAALNDYIYRIFNRLGGRFSLDNPLGKIEDEEWNLRIRAGGFDIRPDSPTISIRKLSKNVLSSKEIRYSMSEPVEEFLRFAVEAGLTIGICGPFGAGKTRAMGTMMSWIPPFKHVGLIQGSNEIPKVHPMMRRSLTRSLVGEQGRAITETDLLEFAKQENYSVIGFGEFLNEAALPMLHILQLNIQSFFTFHANDAFGAIHSFIWMIMQANGADYDVNYLVGQLATYIDIIVIYDRLRAKDVVQFTGELDSEGKPIYQSIFSFDVQEETKHELIGTWKRNFENKLCEKIIRKAAWNGVAIPDNLALL